MNEGLMDEELVVMHVKDSCKLAESISRLAELIEHTYKNRRVAHVTEGDIEDYLKSLSYMSNYLAVKLSDLIGEVNDVLPGEDEM